MKNSFNIDEIICCPNCKGDLIKSNSLYVCTTCGSDYRKKEGILILISKELEAELRK